MSGRRSLFIAISLIIIALAGNAVSAQVEADDKEDAIAIFNQAQDAHEKGDLKTAISLYKKAITIIPEFAEAEYQCGTAYLSLKDTSAAEAAFRRAVEIKPDWTLALTSLGSLLVDSGKYIDASAMLSKAIELDPQNFPAYAALAELRLKTNASPTDLRELLEKLTAATTKANPTASIWAAKASLELALMNRDQARRSLANALATDGSNKSALALLAELAIADGDLVRATDALDRLEKAGQITNATKLLRARLAAADGRSSEALKMLDAIDPATPGLAEFRALVANAGSMDVIDLETRLEKEPKNSVILGRLCKLYRRDDPPKALDRCRRAVEAEPANIDHVIGYGAALVQARAFDQAVGLFRKLIEIEPDNVTAHASLASALFELKRYPEAKVQYEWLIARQPDLVIAYYLLGIVNDHLAEYIDAMANYQQFLKLADPAKLQLEIDKVNLRMPTLQRQVKEQPGKKGD